MRPGGWSPREVDPAACSRTPSGALSLVGVEVEDLGLKGYDLLYKPI